MKYELDDGASLAADMAFLEALKADKTMKTAVEGAIKVYLWVVDDDRLYGPSLNDIKEFLIREEVMT